MIVRRKSSDRTCNAIHRPCEEKEAVNRGLRKVADCCPKVKEDLGNLEGLLGDRMKRSGR
jgi:hypothetical protein